MESAFFDLDKTIIARSSPLALGPSFYKQGLIGGSTLLKAMYAQLVYLLWGAGEGKMERMREEAARLTTGWEVDKVRGVVAEVLEEVISPLIYAEALELMHEHRSEGRLICVVSSSPEEIVAPLAELLQADHHIATRAGTKDGLYTGELDFYCYGPAKVDAIQRLAEERDIDLAGSYAYSDSSTDIPMLESVGHPVVVNPDKSLRAVALEREWEIRYFKNPVSMRDRLGNLRIPDWRMPDVRMPEFRVPDMRMPEMRVPEMSRDLVMENKLRTTFAAVGVVATAYWAVRLLAKRDD